MFPSRFFVSISRYSSSHASVGFPAAPPRRGVKKAREGYKKRYTTQPSNADLARRANQNKSLSDNPDPALGLQGVGWLTRKTIGMATITLDIKQYQGAPTAPADADGPEVTHVDIEQTLTGGLKGTTEKRCIDDAEREHSDWMFGSVRGQSRWVGPAAIEDAFLAKGWLEGDDEKAGPAGETHIFSFVQSLDNGWTATQVWGFQEVSGERRYTRNIVVAKGSDRVQIRLVYDYLP